MKVKFCSGTKCFQITGEEKSREKLNQEIWPDRESNQDPLRKESENYETTAVNHYDNSSLKTLKQVSHKLLIPPHVPIWYNASISSIHFWEREHINILQR